MRGSRTDFPLWEQEFGQPYDWSTDEGSGLRGSRVGLVRGMVAAAGLELTALAVIFGVALVIHFIVGR